jgi:cytochrome P450
MEQIHKLLREAQENPVSMDRVVTEYTLNIAWKQILGLDLAEGEVPEFCAAVNRWIRGLVSARAYLGYKVSESDGYRALQYLEARVGNKIDELERTGPDGVSALSGMVFATDDDKEVTGDLGGGSQEKSKRKLSRKEVIDNALLLVLAGSETASSTLANAVLMLGLHRDAWRKLVEEQRQVRESYGEALTMRALDKDAAPYLDAVIKEALRIRPLSITFPRVATDTLVVEGRQIPRGWFVDWNAVLTHELDPVTFQSDGSHMDILKGFRPERWLSDVTAPSEFIPFGQGPRYCLGSHLAYAEMKVFLSLLARNVDFELSGRNKMKVVWKHASLIAKVKDALPVIVQPAVPSQLRNSSYA